jgi:23S rRNA (cytosine1962-C5)-methyltransferase
MSAPEQQAALAALDAAIARRAPLAADPELDAYRLCHGWSEGLHRIEIDRYGPVATIDARPSVSALGETLAARLHRQHGFESVVLRTRGHAPRVVHGPSPGTIEVREGPLRFAVQPERPRNPGLFLDARSTRQWIRQNSKDRRVLNLFAFTGSLGLSASHGGARSVVHVDQQRSALERTRENYRLNQLPIDDRDLVRLNIYQHLRKSAASRLRYDAVIIDAPPYAPHKDRTPGQRGIFALAELVRPMLEPGGWMLCFFHHLQRSRADLEGELMGRCEGLEVLWQGQSGDDFPETDERNKSRMTAFQVVP